jgi:hypothetical protein
MSDEAGLHPATVAWTSLGLTGRLPTSIETLKPMKRKSAVFRLHDAGPSGESVIAKRRVSAHVAFERHIYGDLLPALCLPALDLYGSLDLDSGYSWIFLQDAGEDWFEPGNREHQALAVRALASLHTAPTRVGLPRPEWLPRTGISYFHEQLRAASDQSRSAVADLALSASEAAVIEELLRSLSQVSEKWGLIVAVSDRWPETIVHGDFVPKNVRRRRNDGCDRLVAFDWETAGWATPAADIAQIPAHPEGQRRYHALVSDHWPGITLADVDRLWHVGRVLVLLHGIVWETSGLGRSAIERSIRRLADYRRYLDDALADMMRVTD